MASRKDLKKDIDTLMSLVLNDCFYILEYNDKVDSEAILKIAGDVIRKHREFRVRAGHPDGKDNPKIIRGFYSGLTKEMLEYADASLELLSAEVKKVV